MYAKIDWWNNVQVRFLNPGDEFFWSLCCFRSTIPNRMLCLKIDRKDVAPREFPSHKNYNNRTFLVFLRSPIYIGGAGCRMESLEFCPTNVQGFNRSISFGTQISALPNMSTLGRISHGFFVTSFSEIFEIQDSYRSIIFKFSISASASARSWLTQPRQKFAWFSLGIFVWTLLCLSNMKKERW